ncbi:KAP family P-loop NTPase fold protein [Carnobacterium maltaromaticum]|uniref:KAP family P-loop NTPase fold protein n=1 Tax=Carnobacterium maltaromaticum TaxID=2751 RepID=UPI0010728B33|nr:P-loop NTPase fold protein [Carnobacterium maltaromaticum]TFJ75501.1 hypothetical protein CKN94_07615 [Carnobacterium maltaromaticum]TFJ78670.1 hypothetical protein CKN97_07610 [Carnobacterium maltaromaticum]
MKIKNKVDVNNEQNLINLLQIDPLKRKQHINNLITLFYNIEESVVVGIDGQWGTGKTIFLKQFEILLNYQSLIQPNIFPLLDDLRKESRVFYFNSWENDMYDSPLQSLLFNLAKTYKGELNASNFELSAFIKYGKNALNMGLKFATGGSLDFKDFENFFNTNEKILDAIITVDEIREKIDKFLNIITKEKKLIIIIDELDRCKPTFAIELLEVIKHYFSHDKVHFILCSNKSELSHTVKRYYGQDFNGYEYLDRFIDFEYKLPAPDTVKYSENVLKIKDDNFFYLSHIVVEYFDLSLRQTNKFALYTELLMNAGAYQGFRDHTERIIILFYYLGLITKNKEDANNLIKGKDFDKLKKFILTYEEKFDDMLRIADGDNDVITKFENYYNTVFNNNNDMNRPLEEILRLLSSIS